MIVLAALAGACGRGGECEEARDAAGRAVAAAWPDIEKNRTTAEQALAAALRRREDLKHWRLEWGDSLRRLQAAMGCSQDTRCCQRMRSWFVRHRKPDTTTKTSIYFPDLVILARDLRKYPGRAEDSEAVTAAIEELRDRMAGDSGGAEVPDQIAAQCESARQLVERVLAQADAVPPQPAAEHAALDQRATAARVAHDWLVALAGGRPASLPRSPPPELRETAAAVKRYQSACHD